MIHRTSVALAFVALAASPAAAAPAPNLVLNCYVTQSGSLGLGQFVRHLVIRQDQALVVIADGLRGEPPRFVGNGRLISLDADRLVFDFAASSSAGRTEIDRRSGAFSYGDGRTLIRGTCTPSAL